MYANGWSIPTATEIAFIYFVERIVFGAGYPAVRFLLPVIVDDVAGLIILAVFYPSGDLAPVWLLLSRPPPPSGSSSSSTGCRA